jgi:hypothetical protein
LSLTAPYVRSILDYDRRTGVFVWKTRDDVSAKWNNKYPGTVAGSLNKGTGYLRISINDRDYSAHRIAWLHVTGEWPTQVDHRNRIRTDNRFKNLRSASKNQNQFNRTTSKNNTSGYKGVYWHAIGKKWCVNIAVNGKQIYLGLHTDIKKAAAAYRKAAKKYHGDFART